MKKSLLPNSTHLLSLQYMKANGKMRNHFPPNPLKLLTLLQELGCFFGISWAELKIDSGTIQLVVCGVVRCY
jgi:hypothetical protein